ncbi:hypothetical protein CGCF413_v009332 [Colletotrichum fructicola]|nr:hypothetical protein CGCF413_v009332 [Colletotrichum fructicola]
MPMLLPVRFGFRCRRRAQLCRLLSHIRLLPTFLTLESPLLRYIAVPEPPPVTNPTLQLLPSSNSTAP